MAFLRQAKAIVVHPKSTSKAWGRIRTAGTVVGNPNQNLVAQATEILGKVFNPENFLLTHCTIVASVDVEDVAGVKLGSVKEGSRKINRKYSNYRIIPESDQFINNNYDSFSRAVLLKSYRTFIGGHNFLEHVQIEDQSKGRIIDAVARDIGDSVYIDILVATDRVHSELVADIEAGRLTTLSMGCFIPGTMVTMADGTRVPIEDVQPGDMVLTHKGRSREVLNKQIRGVANGTWNVRRIKARGVPTEITATDIHPFFVFRAAEVCACGCGESLPDYAAPKKGRENKHTTRLMTRRFKVGHDKRILNPNSSYSLDEHRERRARLDEIKAPKMEEVKAADLKVGDFLCFPRADVSDVGDGVTAGLARLLGYFIAEGSFIKYKGDPVEVQFNFSLDEKDTYVAEVVELLRREFPDANAPWTQDRLDRNTCTVHISGRDVAAWFFQHGGEYSHLKRVSAEAMTWPVEMHKHIIGSWINGDGSLHSIHGNTSGTTVSYDLACQMHMLMAQCGVYARMECNIAGRSVDVRQVVNGGFTMRDEATGKLPAFTLVAGQTDAQPLTGYSDKVIADPTFANREFRVLDDVVMFPITSIEADTYEGFVHDMEVDEDHSYNVEGVAVHNCSVTETVCTKCGNVAVDETEMCECVKYAKGNVFIDERGRRGRIAELCGHETLDPDGGVTFIEASWVASPAFTGAVMRNIISPDQINPALARQAQSILASPPPQWVSGGNARAANLQVELTNTAFDFSEMEEGGGDEAAPEEAAPAAAPVKGPLDDVEDSVVETVLDNVEKRIKNDLSKSNPVKSPEDTSTAPNDTLVKEAQRRVARDAYAASVLAMIRTASSPVDLVNKVAVLDDTYGVKTPVSIYRATLKVGALIKYSSTETYLTACCHTLGRTLTPIEAKSFIRLGRILSHAEASLRFSTPDIKNRS